MEYAIATVCLSGGLNEKLQAIAHAGFKCVELFENDLLSFNGTPSDVRRMIEDLGLKTITFQPFREFEGMPDERRARVFQRAKRKFDLMQGARLRPPDGLLERVAGEPWRPRTCRRRDRPDRRPRPATAKAAAISAK